MDKITSAGRLLAEARKLRGLCEKHPHAQLHQVLPAHFKIKGQKYWQANTFRLEKLVDSVESDLDILSEDRATKYRSTLSQVRTFVDPANYGQSSSSFGKKIFGELTMERFENFHENLVLAGRSYTIEQDRLAEVIRSVSDLIAEIEADGKTEIDDAVVEQLTQLLGALNSYDLYGPDGVEAFVGALVGAAYVKGFAAGTPLPDPVKKRLVKVIGVAKAVMDGFVYTATVGQAVEWTGKTTLLLS